MPAAYGDDLAYIHHVGYAGFAEERAPELIALLREARAKSIVELGCGTGLATRLLTKAGFTVLGIDSSPAMLKLARKTAPKAKFRRGSFTQAVPRADAIVAVGEVFNYGRHDLGPVFRRLRKATRMLAFDFAGPGRVAQEASRTFRTGRDWAVLVKRTVDGNRLTREITSFVKHGSHYRRSEETHEQTLYNPAAMLTLLRRAGFKPYLTGALAPGHYAVTAL